MLLKPGPFIFITAPIILFKRIPGIDQADQSEQTGDTIKCTGFLHLVLVFLSFFNMLKHGIFGRLDTRNNWPYYYYLVQKMIIFNTYYLSPEHKFSVLSCRRLLSFFMINICSLSHVVYRKLLVNWALRSSLCENKG